jgi:hypothetical protein
MSTVRSPSNEIICRITNIREGCFPINVSCKYAIFNCIKIYIKNSNLHNLKEIINTTSIIEAIPACSKCKLPQFTEQFQIKPQFVLKIRTHFWILNKNKKRKVWKCEIDVLERKWEKGGRRIGGKTKHKARKTTLILTFSKIRKLQTKPI